MKTVLSILLLSILLTACDESPEAKERHAAGLAVDMCHDSLKKEPDTGVKAIIEGSCKLLEAQYEALKHT